MIEEGFESFYGRTNEMVRQYLWPKVENRQEREDVIQETYRMALERWDMLRCHPNPCGWLLLTARHIWSREQRHTALCLETYDMENLIYEEPAYEMVLMEDLLHSLYGGTDEKLARGYFLDGSTVAELAEDMQLSTGGVRTRLYRIRKKLRDEAK